MARKLLNDPAIDPLPICNAICYAEKTVYGICPAACEGLCPTFCVLPPLFTPPPPPPPPLITGHKSRRISVALTVPLVILAAAFLLFTCYTVYKFCSTRYRSRRSQNDVVPPDDFLDEEHGPIVDHPIWYIRTIGLQPSVISAITIVRYKRGEGLIEGTDCAVCLNEFEEDETLRLLPKCNHAFHIPCVDTWLRSHTNCPMCRAGIVNSAAAPVPSQEPVVRNSGLIENQPEIISGSEREVRGDSEHELSETRPGIEDDGISRPQSGLKINDELDGVIAMRRSVSLDSLSASMISAAIGGQSESNSDNQLVKLESAVEIGAEGVGSMQSAGASSLKRSVSCSAVGNGAHQQEQDLSVDIRTGSFRPGPLQLVSE